MTGPLDQSLFCLSFLRRWDLPIHRIHRTVDDIDRVRSDRVARRRASIEGVGRQGGRPKSEENSLALQVKWYPPGQIDGLEKLDLI